VRAELSSGTKPGTSRTNSTKSSSESSSWLVTALSLEAAHCDCATPAPQADPLALAPALLAGGTGAAAFSPRRPGSSSEGGSCASKSAGATSSRAASSHIPFLCALPWPPCLSRRAAAGSGGGGPAAGADFIGESI
jgi:hypothetical protein